VAAEFFKQVYDNEGRLFREGDLDGFAEFTEELARFLEAPPLELTRFYTSGVASAASRR
jgi:hypothetical protein